jgi:hypothetical protein
VVLRVQERERAARHARSVPLIAVTVALAVLTWLHQDHWAHVWPVEVVAPTATFLIVWLVMIVQRQVSGAGWGRDGYGIVVAVLAALVVLPLGMLLPMFVGAEALIGVGLGVLGWRGRDRLLWGSGLALVGVGLLVHLTHTADVLVLLVTTVVLAALAARALREEIRVTRAPLIGPVPA